MHLRILYFKFKLTGIGNGNEKGRTYKKENVMKGKKFFGLFVSVLCFVLVGPVFSETISPDINDFAVFAGGKLSVSKRVGISGDIGSGYDMWLGSKSKVDGFIYSGGKFSVDSEFSATGRIISKGNVCIGTDANLFSIDSKGSIYVGNNSKVGALSANRNLQIGRYVAVNGDAKSNCNVNINSYSFVHGDMVYGRRYWIDSRSGVDGDIIRGRVTVDDWRTSKRTAPTIHYGSQDLYYRSHTNNTLTPGDYRRMSVREESILRLSAGTYNFYSVWLDDDVRIIADTSKGDVLINVAGSFSSDDNLNIQKVGDGQIVVQALRGISLDKGTQADANFLSFCNFSLGEGSKINGQLYANRNMWIGKETQIAGFSTSPNVPEPATLGLLLMSLVMLKVKSRRMAV